MIDLSKCFTTRTSAMNPYAYSTELARATSAAEDVLKLLRSAGEFGYCNSWKEKMRDAERRLADLTAEFQRMRGGF